MVLCRDEIYIRINVCLRLCGVRCSPAGSSRSLRFFAWREIPFLLLTRCQVFRERKRETIRSRLELILQTSPPFAARILISPCVCVCMVDARHLFAFFSFLFSFWNRVSTKRSFFSILFYFFFLFLFENRRSTAHGNYTAFHNRVTSFSDNSALFSVNCYRHESLHEWNSNCSV